MGKFRTKLKGQTKGRRWRKGQSSSSNPSITKHRDLAKGRFFHENLGKRLFLILVELFIIRILTLIIK